MSKEKTYLCLCLDCGGQRQLIGNCRLCDSTQTPEAITETLIFNMELGYPTIEEAIDKFETYLDAAYDAGFKSMVVIHGYGSSGAGGGIKQTIRRHLEGNYYIPKVSNYYFGEDLKAGNEAFEELLKARSSIKKHQSHFLGNAGTSVLLLG